MAVRQNTQRAFLFVSKVLGKHLPVEPATLLAAGKLLALAWLDQKDEQDWAGILKGGAAPSFSKIWDHLEHSRYSLGRENRTLFLGFAETATGLARAVADCFDGEMAYISTTRVDDELTTGNTALRLIRQLHAVYGIRRFTLMVLVDNSEGGNRRAIEQELGIEIRVVSLVRGHIAQVRTGELPPLSLSDYRGAAGEAPALLSLPGNALSDRTLQSASALALQRARCLPCAIQLRQ